MAGPPNNQYAVLGSRLGFRLNYQGALTKARNTWATFLLDGLPVKVRYNSVTIHDIINDTPDTCALTIDARTPPNVGQRLTVRINSNAPRLLFAGPIQTVGLTYEGKPNQTVYPCQAIDDTPVANRKLPYGQWVNTSATTIGQWLVTTFCAPGFSSAAVQAGLPPISVNFDATEGMDGCLRQVAKLIGGYFYWEDKVLHLFQDGEPGDTPDPIDATHPFLNDPPISVSTDTSQVRTRTYGKGYAESILNDVAANDPIVPITNAVMFNPAGGQAVSETQRLKYTGTIPGGAGTVVGPGISPSAAPVATVVAGAGIPPGVHEYAVSFATAAGESLVGPRVSVNLGTLPPPATAPTVTPRPAAGGNGPDAGGHYYAVSFVTASGETVPGPQAPFTQPTITMGGATIDIHDQPGGFGFGELPPGGTVRMWYTYSSNPDLANYPPATGLNETGYSNPSNVWTILQFSPGYGKGFGFWIPYSQDPNVQTVHVWISINGAPIKLLFVTNIGFRNVVGGSSTYSNQYVSGSISSYPQLTGSNPIVGSAVHSNIPIGPAGVTGRKIWRTKAAQFTPFYLAGNYTDNTTTTWTDTNPDNTLVTLAPTVGTATAAQVQLTGIPLGAATVTGRKIYRTAAGLAQLKLLATLADNITTAYLDVLADAGLGANAPAGDTSGIQQPAGSVLAGAASIIVAGAGWASAGGGWAVIGNGAQVIRYTGISGNTITGIPATGPGAIVATISYNSTITAAAALLGVTGLLRALIKGAPINLWVQRDDLAAQAAVALDGTDGIIEHLITDERRGELSLSQLCDADLAQYSTPILTVPYATRDVKTKSGKPITFAIASPAIYATLTIQDVTITEINLAAGTNPRFTVTASSVRFSLEDMLRRLGASLDVTS